MVGLSEIMPTDLIVQSLVSLSLMFGFIEWRFRALTQCIKRVDGRVDNHLENAANRKTAL